MCQIDNRTAMPQKVAPPRRAKARAGTLLCIVWCHYLRVPDTALPKHCMYMYTHAVHLTHRHAVQQVQRPEMNRITLVQHTAAHSSAAYVQPTHFQILSPRNQRTRRPVGPRIAPGCRRPTIPVIMHAIATPRRTRKYALGCKTLTITRVAKPCATSPEPRRHTHIHAKMTRTVT